MAQEQLLLEMFNGILELQTQVNTILQTTLEAAKETTWETWVKYHIPNILQLIAIGAGIWMVRHQIQKQHKSNLDAQDDKIRTNLKIQLRSDIEKYIEELSEVSSSALIFPFSLRFEISQQAENQKNDIPIQPLSFRMASYNDLNNKVRKEAVNLLHTFEKYEIVAPELKLYKTAFVVFLHDFNKISMEYGTVLSEVLPFEVPSEDEEGGMSIISRPLPSKQQMERLKKLGALYQNTVDQISSWILDLRVSIQNIALGHLFPCSHLEYRNPLAENEIVLRTDPESIRVLNDYFENQTDWGKQKQKTENEVREALASGDKNFFE